MFASLVPRHRSSEFFGFWGVFEKFAGILGPALFAEAIRTTGSSRAAILSIVFFVAGAAILLTVDLKEGSGRRARRSAGCAARRARHPRCSAAQVRPSWPAAAAGPRCRRKTIAK